MSDLTQLLDSVVSVAKKDLSNTVLPAVAAVVPQLLINPSAAGSAVLAALAAGGVTIAADELQAVTAWTSSELNKLVAKVKTIKA